jgi:hypothetical protein
MTMRGFGAGLLVVALGGAVANAAKAPVLTVAPESLAFGQIAVGQYSTAQTFTLTNTSAKKLTLSSVTLSDTANYSMTSTCGKALAPAETCVVKVTFQPTIPAQALGTVTIKDRADAAPILVNLSGKGRAGVGAR